MIIDVPIQHPLIDTFLYDPSATLKGTSWPPGREQAGKHVCAKMDATGMFSCASLLDGISGVARGLSRVVFPGSWLFNMRARDSFAGLVVFVAGNWRTC